MKSKSQHKTVLSPDPSFQVFYRIFSKRKTGLISSGIILFATFFEIFCFLLQSYLSFTNEESDFIDVVNDLTSYIYTVNIIDLNKSIYIGARGVLFVASYAYFILFLLIRWTLMRNKQIQELEKIFAFMNSYYNAVIFLPILEISFREVCCDESVMIPFEQQCLRDTHIFTFTCAVLAIVCTLIMALLNGIYSLNGIYDKKNYLSGESKLYDGFIILAKIIMAILMANKTQTRAFLIVYLSVHLGMSGIVLFYFMVTCPYNKIFTEYFSLVCLTIYFAESFSFLVFVLMDDNQLTLGYILCWFVIIMMPGFIYLYKCYKTWLVNQEKTQSIPIFLLKVQNLLQLKHTEKINTLEEIQFRGILVRHIENCTLPRCFCKEVELFESKKHRSVEMSKWHHHKALMLKYYARTLFEDIVKKNPKDPELLISYAEFLFEKFRNTHLALYQIMKLIQFNKFLHPFHRFKILKLKCRISEYINGRNLEALDKTLEVESVIFVEEQLDKAVAGMREIIVDSINFWSYLLNKELDLNRVNFLVEKMYNSVESTEKLWIPLKGYLSKQKKLLYFYNWFLKDFLHKRILLSEEEIDELFENDTFSVYSNEFLNIIRDDTIIFQEDSAVIHMSGHYSDLGKIIKTNRAATKIFKFTKNELEKSNVNILMPKIIANKHNYYLESHIQTGKTRVLYNQKKTFAKDRDGFIMPMWIVVKQLNNSEGLVQYAGLLRPLSQKKDEQSYYVLMNNLGEINGISRNLVDFLKLPKDMFQKRMVNMVLLAPKIIKYLDFARILQDEKEKKQEKSEDIEATFVHKEKEPKKESLSKLVFMKETSPFMVSQGKVTNLKDFLDLDILKSERLAYLMNHDVEGKAAWIDNDINQNAQEDKEIEFTFRLPENLEKFLKDFNNLKTRKHELLNNQQLLFRAIESKDVFKKVLKDSEASPTKGSQLWKSLLKGNKKTAVHLASFKHAMDSYLEALKIVSFQIAHSDNSNVYRIKGFISTDQYGPDNDIVKYIKIVEITKKIEKFSNFHAFGDKNTPKTPKGDFKDLDSLSFSHSFQSRKVSPYKSKFFSPTKISKQSVFKFQKEQIDSRPGLDEEKTYANSENEIPRESTDRQNLIFDQEQEELESPLTSLSKPLVSQISEKSSRKGGENEDENEDEEQKSTNSNESLKQSLLNELKNNLLSPFQSIYQKEENLLMDNNFRSLNNVKWFIRILFFTIIPMNIIIYFAGTNIALSDLNQSIKDIFLNEDLRKDYFRAHEAMITLMLDNIGAYNGLTNVTAGEIDQLLAYSNQTLKTTYQNILIGNSEDEWTSVLYKYVPKIQSTTSMNYKGIFENLTIDAENSIQKMTNSLSDISLLLKDDYSETNKELYFYRSNSFQKLNSFLSSVTAEIFSFLHRRFNKTEEVSSFILIFQIITFFLSFFVIAKLIFMVIRRLQEILTTFTSIENKYLREAYKYFGRLNEYLEASVSLYITENLEQEFFKKSAFDVASKQVDNNVKYKKMFKTINDKSFKKKEQIRILTYYAISIILSCGLNIAFHVETMSSLNRIQSVLHDSKLFLKLNPVYITSIIALKELQFNKTFYEIYDLPYMEETIHNLGSILNTTLFQNDMKFIRFMNSYLVGKPCDTFSNILSEAQVSDCENLFLNSLSNGLVSFHNILGTYVKEPLNLEPPLHGDINMDLIYGLGQLIHIVDAVWIEATLEMWKQDIVSYSSAKERWLVFFLVFISVLNIVVYIGAEIGVVGTLNKSFLLYRKIFNKYMLGEALVREKRIKSRLVKYKLLNK